MTICEHFKSERSVGRNKSGWKQLGEQQLIQKLHGRVALTRHDETLVNAVDVRYDHLAWFEGSVVRGNGGTDVAVMSKIPNEPQAAKIPTNKVAPSPLFNPMVWRVTMDCEKTREAEGETITALTTAELCSCSLASQTSSRYSSVGLCLQHSLEKPRKVRLPSGQALGGIRLECAASGQTSCVIMLADLPEILSWVSRTVWTPRRCVGR